MGKYNEKSDWYIPSQLFQNWFYLEEIDHKSIQPLFKVEKKSKDRRPKSKWANEVVDLLKENDEMKNNDIIIALNKRGINITGKEAGFISGEMLRDFGKMGLKGGKLLRWLQLEYDVLFESLIYEI